MFDFKKEYKDLYMPRGGPVLITVPPMEFIMVDGSGDPNGSPAFQEAIEMLYGLSYSIKMSNKKGLQPEGYFEYVVPPLEGLWWTENGEFSLEMRSNWKWTLMIRQPEFVTNDTFAWARGEVARKRPGTPVEKARFETFDEGLCVQAMHAGPYSTEPETMAKINEFIALNDLEDALGSGGKHHEIYLTDPRKGKPENQRTVLRHPVRRRKA